MNHLMGHLTSCLMGCLTHDRNHGPGTGWFTAGRMGLCAGRCAGRRTGRVTDAQAGQTPADGAEIVLHQHAAHQRRELAGIDLEDFVLHAQQPRGQHRERPQPHAQQQRRHAVFPGHFAADADRLVRLAGCTDGQGDETQHGRVQLVVHVGDAVIGTVDGQRVLHQVVGADRQKIQLAGKDAGRQCGRRHLDHAAHRNPLGHRLPADDEFLPRLVEQQQRLVHLLRL